MFRDLRPRSRALIAATTLGVIAAPLSFLPSATANPAGTGLVIKEVYGAGGNANASYKADFVELYNPTDDPISINGWSLQYRAAGYTTGNPSVLSLPNKVVPAHDNYLVSVSTVGSVGADLPTPDFASTALSMGGASGQVILSNGTANITATGNLAGVGGVVDAVGYGTATSFEGAATGTALTSVQSVNRSNTGTDTDNNTPDFTIAAPTPTAATGDTTPPPPPSFTGSIAEIQGTGATTPKNGATVTTTGVVTAAYPTGGFNGFWMQTPGADTPDASDAIFVFAGNGGTFTMPAIGDHVEVIGTAGEAFGVTQIVPGASGSVTTLAPASEAVQPRTTLPGAGCAEGACPTASE